MRVAAVDLGTNSTRLLVAEVADGRLADELHRETRITRLGEGVDERKRLLPVPIARVRNVLSDFRRIAEKLDAERTLLVATSAVRDAENGEAFLGEVEWSYGFTTQLLSGDEEALLTLRGVTSRNPLREPSVVVDVGGGSTELTLADETGPKWRDSLDIGSVRLTERFLRSDPPTTDELESCGAAVRELLEERVPDDVREQAREAIGVAGTITSLAALDLQLDEYDRDRVHEHVLTPQALREQVDRLAAMTTAERRTLPAFDPDRAPVIVGGAIVAREVLGFLGVGGLKVSERDILDGTALAAAELPEEEEGAAPPGAYTCC